jgi:triphosphatase
VTETELKILLDAETEARLRRDPALAEMRVAPPRTRQLVSIYHDTPGHDLARARIALRLRKTGRRWVQTVKKSPDEGSRGLFATLEIDRPAPGGRLKLDHDDPDGVYRAIAERAGEAAIGPVFETRVRRTSLQLRAETGVVELAIDRGEVIAGALSAPIREAEIELVEGSVEAIFAVARRLFTSGPVRFASEPKSARGMRLARRGEAEAPQGPRKAGSLDFGPETGLEAVVRDVLRDCFAQVADNLVVVADSDDPEGSHQLRVGLRRLRSALSTFAPSIGREALQPLGAAARELGRVVGPLRDLDVLAEEMLGSVEGLDGAAREALGAAVEARRRAVREEVRAALAGGETVGFVFDLAAAIEGRRWLVPSDYSQTARLAAPIGEVAPAMLGKRWRKAMKKGRRIGELDAEGLHELRKELKKLRYSAEMLGAIYPAKRYGAFIGALKKLQDRFGSLNDAAMAAELLSGPEAPGAGDAAAQRAVGWLLGGLAVTAAGDRPRLEKAWRKLEGTARFWE